MLFKKLMRIGPHLFVNKLLPPCCVLCHFPSDTTCNICSYCRNRLPAMPPHCAKCARFLPVSVNNGLCGRCLSQPPSFDQIHALFPYKAPVTHMMTRLKFQGELSHARAFGELLIQQIPFWYAAKPLPDMIIPVPLHPLRLRERGFNQALEIIKPVSRHLTLPIDISGSQRIRHTAAQSSLPAAKRQNNVAHAFAVTADYTGQHLAVVDDVITTGHTILEFCRVLRHQGARRLDVWCCARRG